MHRFYAPELPAIGELVDLPDDEGRHLVQVLRLAEGDDVRVFDGKGREHAARVERAGRGRASLRLGGPASAAPEAPVQVTLAAALLKGDRFDDVVRDATMLGAAAIQPIVTARTEIAARRGDPDRRVERWRRIAISSAKQCGRAVVPAVAAPLPFAGALRDLPRPLLLAVEPAAASGGGMPDGAPPAASLLVGPEGGWAPEEIDAARAAGARQVSFGRRTLRADAAPLVTLTVLLHEWGGL
jgi:16S rRNA (uracil1498-N3)-methyltransferase